MEYIRIENYNKETTKVSLFIALTLLWALTSIFFIMKKDPFRNVSSVYASDREESYDFEESVLNVGPNTEKLIEEIVKTGLDPVVARNIKREFFSVEGKIIALSKDNIHVFEYKDGTTLLNEVHSFRESANTPSGSWKKDVHLFKDENLIVFYKGEKKSILNSLQSIFGEEVVL